ncbi:MAG: LamG domain-containing protein [Candidatus Pacebacteria bacterium]|nr:LamG domain-containing protein [Candidatus Paceibacterota bacterium]
MAKNSSKKNLSYFSAFTLIEIMVVIVIIAVLAGIVMALNSGATQKAIDTKVRTFANGIPMSLSGNYVASWKFDQINVPAANQTPSAWGDYPGTLSGLSLPTLQTTGCVDSNCLYFNGVDATTYSYVNVPSDLTTGLKALTFECWVNGQQAANIIKSENNSIILHFRGAGFYLFASDDTASNYLGWNSTLAYNVWTHLVATWDGATMKLYVNGTRQASTLAFAGGAANKLHPSTYSWIGHYFNSGQLGFKGYMDELRFYNEALSIGQIRENYYAGVNKLLAKNIITVVDYQNRIAQINNNLANK